MNKQTLELNRIIGQIEDELNAVRSAQEQVGAVLGANETFCASAEKIINSTNTLTETLSDNAKITSEALDEKIELLKINAAEIDSHVRKWTSKVNEDTVFAQLEAKKNLQLLTKEITGTISRFTQESLTNIEIELTSYKSSTEATRIKIDESTTTASVKFDESIQDAIARFNEKTQSIIDEQSYQVIELTDLNNRMQEKITSIETKFEELQKLNMDKLDGATEEIRRHQIDTMSEAKKLKSVIFSGIAANVILLIAVLVKLFLM